MTKFGDVNKNSEAVKKARQRPGGFQGLKDLGTGIKCEIARFPTISGEIWGFSDGGASVTCLFSLGEKRVGT
jgi:hypothetical protein